MKSFFIYFSKLLFFIFVINMISCKDRTTSMQVAENKEITKPESLEGTSVEMNDSSNRDEQSSGQSETIASNSPIAPDVNNELKTIPGPKGFVIKNKTILREEPIKKAKPVETLKEGDIIYLLESAPVDERGYPTWFKVQSANNKTGWLVATSVSFGH